MPMLGRSVVATAYRCSCSPSWLVEIPRLRHMDFQSIALPSELTSHNKVFLTKWSREIPRLRHHGLQPCALPLSYSTISTRRESNPHCQVGNLVYCLCTTNALKMLLTLDGIRSIGYRILNLSVKIKAYQHSEHQF